RMEPIELAPRRSYIRRLQHQLVERFNLSSRSVGDEPMRRLRILPPASSQNQKIGYIYAVSKQNRDTKRGAARLPLKFLGARTKRRLPEFYSGVFLLVVLAREIRRVR